MNSKMAVRYLPNIFTVHSRNFFQQNYGIKIRKPIQNNIMANKWLKNLMVSKDGFKSTPQFRPFPSIKNKNLEAMQQAEKTIMHGIVLSQSDKQKSSGGGRKDNRKKGPNIIWFAIKVALSFVVIYVICDSKIWGSAEDATSVFRKIQEQLQICEPVEPHIGRTLYRKYKEIIAMIEDEFKMLKREVQDGAAEPVTKLFQSLLNACKSCFPGKDK